MNLSHIDENLNPKMVDVADKAVTYREATAEIFVTLPVEIMSRFDGHELVLKKGPVLQTAIIAGVMAAKKTHELIPMCHPMPIERCDIGIRQEDNRFRIEATVGVHHKTGVEMEALVACNIAALTIYDMCKALSHDIVIERSQLIAKSGGKHDFRRC